MTFSTVSFLKQKWNPLSQQHIRCVPSVDLCFWNISVSYCFEVVKSKFSCFLKFCPRLSLKFSLMSRFTFRGIVFLIRHDGDQSTDRFAYVVCCVQKVSYVVTPWKWRKTPNEQNPIIFFCSNVLWFSHLLLRQWKRRTLWAWDHCNVRYCPFCLSL